VSPALAIAAKDLRQKVRDRSAIILSVVAPLALAFLFSMMIPAGSDTFDATYAVVDLDGGPIARALVDGPLANLGPSGITVVTAGSDAEARASVGDGSASAAIVIPAGFSAAILSGQPARITIVGSVNATLATQVLQSIVASFGSSVEGVELAVATVLATGGESAAGDPATIAQEAQAMAAPVTIATADTKDRLASSNTYYAASMAVLFVFFAAQFGVVSLLGERRAGTLARLLASPISARTVLIGKLLVSIVLGLVSMTTIAVATTLLLGAHWGDPIAVAALIATTVLAASGIALVVVGFARTEDQAASLTAIVALVLAVLGGSFFPLSQAPEALATLSLATPHAWFLRGIGDLASGEGIGAVLPSVAVLGLLGLATCAIGLVRAERAVIPR
jgi:ABC-2 type transport system permease protein